MRFIEAHWEEDELAGDDSSRIKKNRYASERVHGRGKHPRLDYYAYLIQISKIVNNV